MRWVSHFILYAIVFGLGTEAFDVFLDGEAFDLAGVIIRGTLFGALMVGWFSWRERHKNEADNGG